MSNIPRGKKIFNEKKGGIKEGMTADEMASWFGGILEKLQKQATDEDKPITVKEEPFVFSAFGNRDSMPTWAIEMKHDLEELQECIQNDNTDTSDDQLDKSEVLAFNPVDSSKSNLPSKRFKNKCKVCGKFGHSEQKCYYRICKECNGKGHDANMCPSARPVRPSKQKQNGNKTSPRQ